MAEFTPFDVLGKTFRRRLHGYGPEEVHEFLSQVATAMETVIRERGEFKHQLARLEQEVGAYRDRERALQEALVAAQQAADNTLVSARGEAQHIVDEGQALADRLLEEAHQRARNIESVISDLRSRRRESRSELLRLVEVLQGVIEDDRELERRQPSTPQIAVLHPRKEGLGEA